MHEKKFILGFYKGFGITGSTYPFYVGIQFSIYKYLKEDYGYFGAPVAGFKSLPILIRFGSSNPTVTGLLS